MNENEKKQLKSLTVVLAAGQIFFFSMLAVCISAIGVAYDYFYMVPTGRYILNHGIMRSTVFSVLDMKLVVQQWLYCVYLYVISPLGGFGIIAGILLVFLLINLVVFRILRVKGVDRISAGLVLFFCFAFSFCGYLLEIRPESVTFLLCVLEIYLIEKYIKTGRAWLLYLLPLLMLLEINLHGSMWVVHYIVALPYLFGFVLTKIINRRKADGKEKAQPKKNAVHVILTGILMTLMLFVNPYGIDMILYTPRTFLAKTFRYLTVSELGRPDLFSPVGLAIVIVLAGTVFLVVKKKISYSSLCAVVIYLVMAVTYNRNISYIYLAMFYFLTELALYLKGPDVNLSLELNRKQKTVGIILSFLAAVSLSVVAYKFLFLSGDFLSKNVPTKIIKYLDENASKDTVIYTGFNSGNYLEYSGYENIYVDSRPEIYMEKLNGTYDLLPEYSKYACYVFYSEFISDEEYREYLDRYGFEYLVTDVEMKLRNYLERSGDYELVLSDRGYSLYRRV